MSGIEDYFKEIRNSVTPQLYTKILQYLEEWKSKTTPETWDELRKAEPIVCHWGLGMWIRNTYLWKDEEIQAEFHSVGCSHVDDMSHVILEIWIEELNK